MTLPSLHRQRGNTLTGFIIGLIIGLGIAVAVALTITKGATPFTDKSGKLGRPADPAPADAADPNKPLYGNRDAARAANRAIIAKEEKPAPSEQPPLVFEKPAPKAETKPEVKGTADADPLGKVIASLKEPAERHGLSTTPPPAAAPAPAAAAAALGEDRFTYYLQAGAFRDMTDAESTRAKLALLGFEAAISDRNSDSGVLHRVRVGPYAQAEAMNKARAKLLDSGVDVAIVRNQK